MAEWIGKIEFEPDVEFKISHDHGVTGDQVRQAVSCGAHDRAVWHTHPVYGRRLIVTGRYADGSLIAYLKPLDKTDGLWKCLTAWKMED